MSVIRDNLLKASKNGNFLEIVDKTYLQQSRDNRHSLGKDITFLHNEGSIDAIWEFCQLSKNTKEADFFTTRHVFEHALPELDASVASVMNCVKHLVSEAGNDMASGTIFIPFIKYCEADSNRPKEVLQIATSTENGEWLDFIPSAIISGANLQLSEFVDIAIELSGNSNLKIQIQATFAIGRINYSSDIPLVEKALKALEKVINSKYDDHLYAAILKSAFSLYIADKSLENKLIKLFHPAMVHKEDFTLHAATEIFGFDTKNIPDKLLDVLLEMLKEIKPQNKNSIDRIGWGLQHLMKNGQEDRVIPFLEYLLVNNKDLSIKTFDSVCHDLYGNNHPVLNKLTTKWFLSQKMSLCKALVDIINLGNVNDCILTADTAQIAKQPDIMRVYVARKAVGWLFNHPVSAASFIVPLIDGANNGEIKELKDLLFNPLLISYSGKVKEYLENVLSGQSKKVQSVITDALSRLEVYHNGILSALDIPELLPSQGHRESYQRLFHRQTREATKEAEKHSIMNLIASRSVLLYGRKSINYVHLSDGQVKRTETPLQLHSITTEFPRLEYIDPHGLDYMLRLFKVEGCIE